MGIVRAGLLFTAIVGVAVFFGFTKLNPFSNPYELKAVFPSAMNLKKQTSQVRIAGIEVGRVSNIEPLEGRRVGAIVTMQLEKSGLPVHSDAQLKIRQQLFLEGNYFVDLKPGSPSAPELKTGALVTLYVEKSGLPIHSDAQLKIRQLLFLEGNYFVDLKPGSPSAPELKTGATVPVQQTAIPVQFGDILTSLQSDTRQDLRTTFAEYGLKALNGGGAQGINNSIDFWEPAYKNASLVNDAMLGRRPGDLHTVLRGQQQTLGALAANEDALKGLITNLDLTAAAFAREDDALRAAIPALRNTLKVGPPALRSLNASLPSVSRFARDALPGVRSSGPTLDALIPFVAQLRALVQPSELRGLVADLRPTIPALARLNRRAVPILAESRSLARCSNRVLIPWAESPIPSDEPWNTNQLVMRQFPRSLVGLSGESRINDANTPLFRVNFSGANQGPFGPGPFRGSLNTDAGQQLVGALPSGVSATEPVLPDRMPDHRPDVPCETQEKPNLDATGTPLRRAPSIPTAPLSPELLLALLRNSDLGSLLPTGSADRTQLENAIDDALRKLGITP